jgi:hypothetical protein
MDESELIVLPLSRLDKCVQCLAAVVAAACPNSIEQSINFGVGTGRRDRQGEGGHDPKSWVR